MFLQYIADKNKSVQWWWPNDNSIVFKVNFWILSVCLTFWSTWGKHYSLMHFLMTLKAWVPTLVILLCSSLLCFLCYYQWLFFCRKSTSKKACSCSTKAFTNWEHHYLWPKHCLVTTFYSNVFNVSKNTESDRTCRET